MSNEMLINENTCMLFDDYILVRLEKRKLTADLTQSKSGIWVKNNAYVDEHLDPSYIFFGKVMSIGPKIENYDVTVGDYVFFTRARAAKFEADPDGERHSYVLKIGDVVGKITCKETIDKLVVKADNGPTIEEHDNTKDKLIQQVNGEGVLGLI